ncbi:AbiH family protein [Flavobacterium sp.]|uniref:AbiH family protein n=1 Tax=Flavobacterium sp. TaxID=239 RepID=UPI003D6B954B
MNRIILIGNGFDLAHKFPTSYHNFIDYLWEKICKEVQAAEVDTSFSNKYISVSRVPRQWFPGHNYEALVKSLQYIGKNISYNNRFLEIITDKKNLKNWVDIENEYYQLLKETFKIVKSKFSIEDLNRQFEFIKTELNEYLLNVENEYLEKLILTGVTNDIGPKIYCPFKLRDFTENSINEKANVEYDKIKPIIDDLENGNITFEEIAPDKQRLISRISTKRTKQELRKLLLSDTAVDYFDLLPESILFLNFNYTSSERLYLNKNDYDHFGNYTDKNVEVIHIHGSVDTSHSNPIIFGFGDELDDDYKEIEKLENNVYLDNIKSIKYLETENYKNLLQFINSGKYQILLFGHSCGTSDRTLLNTLFENNNCVSIKPFFYEWTNGNNYSDIIRNISRSFNNKAIMRDKVVNKKYCDNIS